MSFICEATARQPVCKDYRRAWQLDVHLLGVLSLRCACITGYTLHVFDAELRQQQPEKPSTNSGRMQPSATSIDAGILLVVKLLALVMWL